MATGREWLAEFEAQRGRPLRVLHIGNIANNAYNNAKIQRQRGIEADVSSHDYFHVMACPEWEDAEFEGDVVDAFFPDWWNVDTNGFRRPTWFAQGNARTCQRYFAARRREGLRAKLLGKMLTVERWLWCRSTPTARVVGYRGGLMKAPRIAGRGLRSVLRVVLGLGELLRGRGLSTATTRAMPVRLATRVHPGAVDSTELGNRFRELFPGRSPLGVNDLRGYREQARGWRDVVRGYDVVQGYALDAIVPVLSAAERWTAYEHGTLRDIPFEDSPSGRICALAYRTAPVVFVTNSDVVPSARRLGLTDEQLVFLPHAVDSDRLFRFAAAHEQLRPRGDDPVTFFSPTRHDWLDRDPSWTKGNDHLIRAFARLRDAGVEARLVLVEWGRHLVASRALIDELKLTEHVSWVDSMSKRALWTEYMRAHAVADQFTLRAIGGVAFEAMALGCRVLTAVDERETAAFFGAVPELLVCNDEDEIAAALRLVADDPLDRAGLGAAARAWFERYHSADRIVDIQLAAYSRVLDPGS